MKPRYKVVGVFDTETTNVETYAGTQAFCCLYIYNDVSACDMREYVPGCESERISFIRKQTDVIAVFEKVICEFKSQGIVPVVCAYNLSFDIQTLIYSLSKKYRIKANAQSSTNIYTLDLLDLKEGNAVLRFWDTYHLEMRGLAAMGETCGFAKAVGSWDYEKTRHDETPLTPEEIFYATRDVQVIPAYLRFILESNEWCTPEMLGFKVITKTSLVRQMAKSEIYGLRPLNNLMPIGKMYELTCEQEKPSTFYTYALRKACFRGGFTFTAANRASQVFSNVASVDAVSMHHAFINGRYVPVHFKKTRRVVIQQMVENVLKTDVEKVLANYERPFNIAFHARVKIFNIRLKAGSVFERDGIALLAQAKFKGSVGYSEYGDNERSRCQERANRLSGWVDSAKNPLLAFGKLMSADEVTVHVNEIELYAMNLVYEWQSIDVLFGEATCKFVKPPDYITIQSNVLFSMKSDVKKIISEYREGVPYENEIPHAIPDGIADGLRTGEISEFFLRSWYTSTVKGQYNGIYGTQAQDVYKPVYTVVNGDLVIDETTKTTRESWEALQPKKNNVLYNYGMRIVGGSRLHLVLAIKSIYGFFGDKAVITGGDTDSIKVSVDESVTDEEIEESLKPLADACEKAIAKACVRIRNDFPKQASSMRKVGSFEIEDCNGSSRYSKHIELWNKTRASLDAAGKVHLTAAGLPQPKGKYTAAGAIEDLINKGVEFGEAVNAVIGYNAEIDNSICHVLQHSKPLAGERFNEFVTDYLGAEKKVNTYRAVALYPASRKMGDTLKTSNLLNVRYLRSIGVDVKVEDRRVLLDEGKLKVVFG